MGDGDKDGIGTYPEFANASFIILKTMNAMGMEMEMEMGMWKHIIILKVTERWSRVLARLHFTIHNSSVMTFTSDMMNLVIENANVGGGGDGDGDGDGDGERYKSEKLS